MTGALWLEISEPTAFPLAALLLLLFPVFGDYIPRVLMLPSRGNSFGMICDTFLIVGFALLVSVLAKALTRFMESWRLPTIPDIPLFYF